MKKVLVLACAFMLVAGIAFAAKAKSYQVTGPVLEVTSDMIVVQKGDDKWQIARDASTAVTGDPKVGSKVTVEYTMKATSIEVKEGKAK